MLPASAQRIQERLDDGDLVLDVGGWGRPFLRADWVLDALPYETRGLYGCDGEGPERFGPDTWVLRDVCEREPWPFERGRFDFAVCSQTLEDLRDPVWVCQELQRVAKAGYVEVPSRLEEQSFGVHGPWVGWSHHRWLIDVTDGRIEFVLKPHLLAARESDHFPAGFHARLSAEERVATLWWEGGFEARERLMTGPEELDRYLADFVSEGVAARAARRGPLPRRRSRLRRR